MNVDVRSKNLAKGRKFLVIAIIVMENCIGTNKASTRDRSETNDSNEDESSEDEALSIIQETSEQDITENIELLKYTSHPMPQSTSLNIESDVYNTSEQNTEMSLGSESNNESYNEIFEDYSPPPYQANMDAERKSDRR
ncbi:unnamed protein product [Rhizophagus irregularis]|nr:unnamed protein product [Rhizophagus irregularis]